MFISVCNNISQVVFVSVGLELSSEPVGLVDNTQLAKVIYLLPEAGSSQVKGVAPPARPWQFVNRSGGPRG